MEDTFKEVHDRFIQHHLSKRTGERRAQLERRHKHGEPLFLKNVWWPLYGNLDHLHPEYEVLDWRGFPYFIDLAYIRPHVRIGWEIKGYHAHVLKTDRTGYRNELNREAFLQGLGWRIISFSADDVVHQPETCRMIVKMVMAQYLPEEPPFRKSSWYEAEILKLACNLGRPLRPIDVVRHFAINHRSALQWIQQLCNKKFLKPVRNGNGLRITQYEIATDVYRLWNQL